MDTLLPPPSLVTTVLYWADMRIAFCSRETPLFDSVSLRDGTMIRHNSSRQGDNRWPEKGGVSPIYMGVSPRKGMSHQRCLRDTHCLAERYTPSSPVSLITIPPLSLVTTVSYWADMRISFCSRETPLFDSVSVGLGWMGAS